MITDHSTVKFSLVSWKIVLQYLITPLIQCFGNGSVFQHFFLSLFVVQNPKSSSRGDMDFAIDFEIDIGKQFIGSVTVPRRDILTMASNGRKYTLHVHVYCPTKFISEIYQNSMIS